MAATAAAGAAPTSSKPSQAATSRKRSTGVKWAPPSVIILPSPVVRAVLTTELSLLSLHPSLHSLLLVTSSLCLSALLSLSTSVFSFSVHLSPHSLSLLLSFSLLLLLIWLCLYHTHFPHLLLSGKDREILGSPFSFSVLSLSLQLIPRLQLSIP